MFQVHDIQLGKLREVYTVPALFSVVRAKWRPGHKHHVTRYTLLMLSWLLSYVLMYTLCTIVGKLLYKCSLTAQPSCTYTCMYAPLT